MKASSFRSTSPRMRSMRLIFALTTIVALYLLTVFRSSQLAVTLQTATSRVVWSAAKDKDDHVPIPHKDRLALSKTAVSDLGRVFNRTLGFETIIAVGLPERSDKRDALDLMAALSGFDLSWVNGVKASSISEKAIPLGIDLNKTHDNFLGSWRGHMDAIRR